MVNKEARKTALEKFKKSIKEEMMDDESKESIQGLKRVTVASPTEEGLKKGLSTAEKLIKLKEHFGLDDEDEEEEEETEHADKLMKLKELLGK